MPARWPSRQHGSVGWRRQCIKIAVPTGAALLVEDGDEEESLPFDAGSIEAESVETNRVGCLHNAIGEL